jgi:exodeoxyribonuclease V beta subunit
MTEPLNPLNLPLAGSRLIEASAGTGKTWTIAALFLRLVLGHGVPAPLAPSQILVMTFTRAATRELSDRIRARLVQAAACFRGAPVPDDDPFLAELLAAHEGPAREKAAWLLAQAAEAMDEAAVLTIDAWCQRMLREHAFDSGSRFDDELQADEAALLDEAVRDYWRQQVYPLDADQLTAVQAVWKRLADLRQDARALADAQLPEGTGQGTLVQCLNDARAQRAADLAALKQRWAPAAREVLAWLQAEWGRKGSTLNKRSLGQASGERWLQAVLGFAADPAADALDFGKGEQHLSPAGLQALYEPGTAPEPPACFGEFARCSAALRTLPGPGAALRLHAAAAIAARLARLKAQAGLQGFADLLRRLDEALNPTLSGPRAERLRERIVEQFPVALIDEFQDTSPRQYAVFDRLYRIAEAGAPGQALLLIGDPKQAIYSFRGADIHSYLRARAATAGRHHQLGTNRRSTQALVGQVNRLFERAEARPGDGAFLFGRQGEERLPFEPVAAAGRPETLRARGSELPALQLHLDAELRGMPESRERLAEACAERIVGWLADPSAAFEASGRPARALRPADLAVLVRTGTEAALVREALRRRGVASVYLSDKDSVFASDEAADLLRLLQAVAAPREVRLARAALATGLLALSLPELQALADDDELFDARCATLQELLAAWRNQGVLAMLRQALFRFELPARWRQRPDGERRLTNVLHLAELLQAASATLEGEAALLRWLARQIDELAETAEAGTAPEEQVLRLESDADLVQVVTVHKSKGLEYPLVLLPFATHFRARSSGPVWLRDAQGGRHPVLEPDAAQKAQAERERLQEDLRLLYVALTRARHVLWLGVAPLKLTQRGGECLWHRSAFGCLVSGPAPRTADEAVAAVQALVAPGCSVTVAGEPAFTPLPPPAALPALPPAREYRAAFDRQWAVSSYSALVKDAARSSEPPPPRLLLRDDEPAEAGAAAEPAAGAAWHRFPRGALAGNFLHAQLEWLADEGFALAHSNTLAQALRRRCERQGHAERADDVQAWLAALCSTPLPPLGAALQALPLRRPELEFWFPSDGLDLAALDRLCHEHLLPGRPRPPLPGTRTLRGLLMGFADLVFEHQGRYWVLDHKSNALGPRDADYGTPALEQAMLEHRYDVQAAIYLLALHRLLKLRLGAAYNPAEQLGGALYLFLRGIGHAPTRGALHLPPPLALLQALDGMLP